LEDEFSVVLCNGLIETESDEGQGIRGAG
jgi:hypothetical protein